LLAKSVTLCIEFKVVLSLLHFNGLLVQYVTMSASSPIALVFGAGNNVGAGVIKAFSAKGYRIATVSRTAKADTSDKRLHIQADLADPESVSTVFGTVRKQLGHPSVVIYNGSLLELFVATVSMLTKTGAAASFVNKDDPLEISLKDAIRDMNINTFSALAAAKEAVKSFEALSKDAARTFIFTGNIMNFQAIPVLMSAGMGKSATAHMIQTAAQVYAARGYR
jgi:NAD(P)-dependent dehydrogenase (short-subunit alcohol dehydrogenase family)